MAPTGWDEISGPAGPLALHVAPGSSPPRGHSHGLVLCHGLPAGPSPTARVGDSLPALADRLASESGWHVVAGCLRGVGSSAGDFSLDGWLEDLRAIVDHCAQLVPDGGVWVVGFGTGGALGLCAASDDERVRGAGCFGSPATFDDWARDAATMASLARRVGVIRSARFPPDLRAWSAPFSTLRPLEAAARMPPRPLLVVHGSDDEEVPVSEGRRLAEAGGARAELRVLLGAGHRLRADPRAVAILTGWLERQGP